MSSDIHLTRALLHAFAKGRVSPGFIRDVLLQHLSALCPIWANRRYANLRLAQALLEESAVHSPDNPREAAHWARLAQAVATRSREPGASELLVRAVARQANAARVQGDLREADRLFTYARSYLRLTSVTETELYAELDRLEGTLRMEQRDFREAEELLTRALTLYEVLGDARRRVHVQMKLANLFYYELDLPQALRAVRKIYQESLLATDPVLFLLAENNLALFLAEAGEYAEAREVVRSHRGAVAKHGNAQVRVRREWIRGKVAAGMGEAEEAERLFREVREVFLREGVGYDAAMVSLDLALLLLDQGRTRELRELAEELVPIFSAKDLHREAAAALRLFQEAVRRDATDLRRAFVAEVSTYLKQARQAPGFRFAPHERPFPIVN